MGQRIEYEIALHNENNPENPVVVDTLPDGMCLTDIEFNKDILYKYFTVSEDGGKTWKAFYKSNRCGITHFRYVLTDKNRKDVEVSLKIEGFMPEDEYDNEQEICNNVVYSADDIQYEEDEACVELDKPEAEIGVDKKVLYVSSEDVEYYRMK